MRLAAGAVTARADDWLLQQVLASANLSHCWGRRWRGIVQSGAFKPTQSGRTLDLALPSIPPSTPVAGRCSGFRRWVRGGGGDLRGVAAGDLLPTLLLTGKHDAENFADVERKKQKMFFEGDGGVFFRLRGPYKCIILGVYSTYPFL